MKSKVVGQTGTCLLSENAIQYRADKKRTLRYRYERIGACYMAVVVGPLKHKCYGACTMAGQKQTALKALYRTLANEYGYHGHLIYSSKDAADAR
jgi:hypothetical protein